MKNEFTPYDLITYGTEEGYYEAGDRWNWKSDGSYDMFFDGNGKLMPGLRSTKPGGNCRICNLPGSKTTDLRTWYLTSDFIIIDCPYCSLPIVVSRLHTMSLNEGVLVQINRTIYNAFGSPEIRKGEIDNHLVWHILIREIDDEERFNELHSGNES